MEDEILILRVAQLAHVQGVTHWCNADTWCRPHPNRNTNKHVFLLCLRSSASITFDYELHKFTVEAHILKF